MMMYDGDNIRSNFTSTTTSVSRVSQLADQLLETLKIISQLKEKIEILEHRISILEQDLLPGIQNYPYPEK